MVALQYLNRAFGEGSDSDTFWIQFGPAILNKFPLALTLEEQQPSFNLKAALAVIGSWKCLLFQRVQRIMGLVVHQTERFTQNDSAFQCKFPFDIIDLEDITEIVKQV